MTKLSGLPRNGTPSLNDLFIMIQAIGPTDVSVSMLDMLTAAFSAAVVIGTNAGSAGGTYKYISIGGFKIMWGQSGTVSVGTNSAIASNLVFPPGLFTGIPTLIPTAIPSGDARQFANVGSISATSAAVYIGNLGPATYTPSFHYICIGV